MRKLSTMDLQQALDILARVGAGETLSLSELTQARDVIARHLHSLRGSATPDLDALTTFRESYFAADAAVKALEAATSAAAAEVDAALADIPDPDLADSSDDEEGDEEDEPPAEEKSSKAKKATMLSVQEAVARLGLTAPATTAPRGEVKDLAATTTKVMLNGNEVQGASLYNLAEAFKDASSRSLKSGKERVARIETSYHEDRTLSGKVAADSRLVDSFVSLEAVTAAGGCCSLPEPIYSNPVSGSTERPIQASLPTLGATRGKFTFYPAICIPVDGVGLWSCEDDELVDEDDPDTWKTCAEVDCDEAEEVGVDAIYTCVTVGNYQSRFAPEQWAGYLSALAIMNARVAEVQLFGRMRSEVTSTHTLDATGSVFVNLVQGVALATASMRQDQRLGDVQMNLWLPEWVKTAVRMEFAARRTSSSAVDDPYVVDGLLATALANEGVTPVYSQDLDPIEGASGVGPGNGPLTSLPATAGMVLAPSGYFTYLDGGSLDLGTEIRDHNLNRQNKIAAFAESFQGLLARGCDARALDLPIEICDSVPCPA